MFEHEHVAAAKCFLFILKKMTATAMNSDEEEEEDDRTLPGGDDDDDGDPFYSPSSIFYMQCLQPG